MRKLQNLEAKSKTSRNSAGNWRKTEPDLTGTQLKKWVINLSKYKLTQPQNRVLAKGLNYAVSPDNVCAEEFVLATELACRKLTYPESVQLRAKVASTLKSAKLPKSNVTKEERKAIKELQKVDSILILPADKGRSTVILDKCEYDKKVTTMLADTKT